MKTTPLVNWTQLRIPAFCVWCAASYGIPDAPEESTQRATALLLANLDEQQRDDYLRMKRFAVRGASGVVYVLGKELYPTAIVNGKPTLRFCAPPHRCHINTELRHYDLPMEDLVLTWKLYIEGDENGFRAIAEAMDVSRY